MFTDYGAARVRLIDQLRREIRDERVLSAMLRVPRELFVPLSHRGAAYEDRPLPIGQGQTISQPLIVALMIEALDLEGEELVLEVGTGSGYQAAILAELSRQVVTVERHHILADRAREVLEELGYANIEVHLAGRRLGWPQGAPYDAIAVAAGAPQIPEDLLDQLANNGRLVVPIGSRHEQELLKVTKHRHETIRESLGPCRWVPLIGDGAWPEA
ncbi:MAG: protein-L-isoaspartate(D-aspartate) O-methyltransferase [Chloroflexi bacterium]|nr:protein-L-isoaspartate(D-aspartate) O-methyltransferase [Chloroflexota bacterium]